MTQKQTRTKSTPGNSNERGSASHLGTLCRSALANKIKEKAATALETADSIVSKGLENKEYKREPEDDQIIAKNKKMASLAKTMGRVADGIRSGQTTYMDRVMSDPDLGQVFCEHISRIELLEDMLSDGHRKSKKTRESNDPNYDITKDSSYDEMSVDHAEYPSVRYFFVEISSFLDDVKRKRGASQPSKRLMEAAYKKKVGKEPSILFDPADLKDIEVLCDIAQKSNDICIPRVIEEPVKGIKRLRAMGITNGDELRSTLREYMKFR